MCPVRAGALRRSGGNTDLRTRAGELAEQHGLAMVDAVEPLPRGPGYGLKGRWFAWEVSFSSGGGSEGHAWRLERDENVSGLVRRSESRDNNTRCARPDSWSDRDGSREELSTLTRVGLMTTPEAHSRVAVVTGASAGIGAATARTLATQGFHVVAVARRGDRIQRLADEIGGTAVVADVTDGAAVEALQPRIMQVLVALAERRGQVVSREFSVFVGDEPSPPLQQVVSREVSIVVPDGTVPAPVTCTLSLPTPADGEDCGTVKLSRYWLCSSLARVW